MSSALNSALEDAPVQLVIPCSLLDIPQQVSSCLTAVDALSIAIDEATQDYGDTAQLQMKLALDTLGWHIDMITPQRNGSRFTTGASLHYLIHATTGEILAKRMYQ